MDTADTLAYSLGGADAASFAIVAASGQIQTRAGVTYDYEDKYTYAVTVFATDGKVTASKAVAITVTDVDEPPAAPAAPTVNAVSESNTSLSVSWTAPANDGKPAITSYDLQYSSDSGVTFSAGPQDVTATSATIASLTAGTLYQVQVRASNDEGDGAWSPSGSGTTNSADNQAPVFSPASVERTLEENTAAGQNVGAPVAATDADTGDTLTYTLGGTDAASFDIVSTSGQIQTKSGVTYDHETKPTYSVTVTANDGTATATATVTIRITDVAEPPAAPAAPTVTGTANTSTSLDVSWSAPANTGPPINAYDLQYKLSTATSWANGPQDLTVTTATIRGLEEDTAYQVQVRASNDEGDSDWSPPGDGRTNPPGNRAPRFASASATRDVPENSPAGTDLGDPFTATDPDTDDTLEYTLEGPDAASFAIVSTSGQIQTKSGVTYDHESQSRYAVTVRVLDGNGGSDTIAVTVRVTDMAEPPVTPTALSAGPVDGSSTSLEARWTQPVATDRPHVASYDLRYREIGEGEGWRNGPQNRPAARTEITGLSAGTAYEVQVRATSAEGDSDWSATATATTHALAVRVSRAPTRHDGSAAFTVQFQFSDDIAIDDEDAFRDNAASAAGGSVTGARRVSGRLWEVTLQPSSDAAVVVSLSPGSSCSASGALCTEEGARLSHSLSHAVPGPDTAVVTIRAVSPAVTEGSPAEFELRRSGAPTTGTLAVSLEAETAGNLLAGSPPATAEFPAGNATVRVEVSTDDDSAAEPGGYVLFRVLPDTASPPAWVLGARAEAAVQVRDNDGGPPPPVPPLRRAQSAPTGSTGGTRRDPVPLKLALWTDKPTYLPGETVQLYHTLSPGDEPFRYRTFAWLEPAGGGARRYLAPLSATGRLHEQTVDRHGRPAATASARHLFTYAAEKALSYRGLAPAPGPWRFVLELRPGSAAEQDPQLAERLAKGLAKLPQARRAWAPFSVARQVRLLNPPRLRPRGPRRADPGQRRPARAAAPAVRARRRHPHPRARHGAAGVWPTRRDHRPAGRQDRRRRHPGGPGRADLQAARGAARNGLLGRAAHPRQGPGDAPGGRGAGRAGARTGGLRGQRFPRLQRQPPTRARGVRGRGGGTRLLHPGDRTLRCWRRHRGRACPSPCQRRPRHRLLGRHGLLRALRGQRIRGGRAGLAARLARLRLASSTSSTAPGARTPSTALATSRAGISSRARCRRWSTSPWCTPIPTAGAHAGRSACACAPAAACGLRTCW